MISAPVNKIIPFSLVDGPGSRTAVFLQGCNLMCSYCHNPETRTICNNCGICVSHCPSGALEMQEGTVLWNEDLCTGCDRCISLCHNSASPRVRRMSSGEVLALVEENIPFIRGITVSGGECTLYPDFLVELFSGARQFGLGTLIDSNGTVDFTLYPHLFENLCDGVMLDVKSWDGDLFFSLTRGSNSMIRRNLRYLADIQKLEEIRIVCIQELTDPERAVEEIGAAIGDKLHQQRLKLIQYRDHGVKDLINARGYSIPQLESLALRASDMGFGEVIIQ